MTHSQADIVARALVDLGLASDPEDSPGAPWPVSSTGEMDDPDSVVTVTDTAGTTDGRAQKGGAWSEHFGVQVRVRAAVHPDAWAKVKAIADALDTGAYLMTVMVPAGDELPAAQYLVHCFNRRGAIAPLGKDVPASKRTVFTVNYVLPVRQLS